MAGNSQRRGATRKPGSKKGATVGSGGQRRKGLEGRGPTPKAEDRVYHAAHKRKVADEKRVPTGRGGAARGTERAGTSRGGASRGGGPKGRGSVQEIVAGRNSVLEALRARIPVEVVYLASRLDADDRTREIVDIVAGRGYDLRGGQARARPPHRRGRAPGRRDQGAAVRVRGRRRPARRRRGVRAAAARRRARRRHGPAQPRRGAPLRGRVRRARRPRARAPRRGRHRVRVEGLGRRCRARPGGPGDQPRARARRAEEGGCFVVGLDAGGTTAIGDLQLATEPLVVVAGSEGKGLSRLVREACDVVASIPIGSDTESLNAAVATGISLYEVARLRREV